MQNQQGDTFVFGSINGFLKRYQADAKFAQEAQKKAEGVLDGSVKLISSEDIRPLALRLCRRLVNSETVLFSFYLSISPNGLLEAISKTLGGLCDRRKSFRARRGFERVDSERSETGFRVRLDGSVYKTIFEMSSNQSGASGTPSSSTGYIAP